MAGRRWEQGSREVDGANGQMSTLCEISAVSIRRVALVTSGLFFDGSYKEDRDDGGDGGGD